MTERYINFFTDFGFKKLFGSEPNKDLLIDFLNALLKDYEEPIIDLTYKKNERLGRTELDRKAIFDLYCENEKGEKFIVELQKAEQKYFKDRSLFYATFPIQEQAQRGEWDFKLKSVYTVGILDFVFDEDLDDPDKYFYHVKLTDQDTNKVFYDKLTFVYLEMPKFNKTEAELENHFEKWLYAIKNLAKLNSIPENLKDKIFEKFFEIAQVEKLSKEDRAAYENSLKYYRDIHNVIDTAEEKGYSKGMAQGMEKGIAQGMEKGIAQGMEKGIAQGMEKGIAQGMAQGMEKGMKNEQLKIARQMLANGLAVEVVAGCTGLSENEIETLKG